MGVTSELPLWPAGGLGAESEGSWAGPALGGEGKWNLSGRGRWGRRGLMDCIRCRGLGELGKVSGVWKGGQGLR